MDKLVDRQNIQEYIPQKSPMVMVDYIYKVSEQLTETGFEVQTDNIFVEEGELQAPALVENIAQTAAAQTGYLAKQEGKQPPVGFIGAVKNLKILGLPKVGDVLRTRIEVEHQIMNFTVIQGTVESKGKVLATCQMKIFLQEENKG